MISLLALLSKEMNELAAHLDKILDKQSSRTMDALAILNSNFTASIAALQQLQIDYMKEMAEVRTGVRVSLGMLDERQLTRPRRNGCQD